MEVCSIGEVKPDFCQDLSGCCVENRLGMRTRRWSEAAAGERRWFGRVTVIVVVGSGQIHWLDFEGRANKICWWFGCGREGAGPSTGSRWVAIELFGVF